MKTQFRINEIKKYLLVIIVLAMALPAGVSASPAPLPDAAFISGVVGHAQTYALSCESRSTADLTAYWGKPIGEVEFFNALPSSDDPEKGFVGSVHGAWGQTPPNPYGVHAKPVAKLLREYGFDAQAQRGMSFTDLKAEIAASRPVVVWVIGGVWAGTPITYTAKDGSQTIVAKYEHTMLMIGYDQNYVYLIDAGNGGQQTHSIKNFKNSWAVLGNLAVTASLPGGSTKPGGGESGSTPSGETYVVQPGDYLSKLADLWGISWPELAAINGITYPYTIFPGQVLKTGKTSSTPEPSPTAKPTSKPTQKPEATATPAPTNKPPEKATPIPTEKPKESGKTYTVLQGEHLMQIARKLNLDWYAIAQLNGLVPPYLVYPNQVLKLPGKEAGNPPPPLPTATQTPATEKPSGNTYVVQRGDYLVALGRKFNISWQVLASLNNITYPYTIYPGQVLKLP